ncbi:putative translation elongation factor G2 [Tothia fuscella]|uniref:Ribosome-releasing factor 2, mitochondrial n=1 Tax=Tothia fuscella TaxID=1048955 RepID=A0A9P4TUL5_9PEZI|nr:putative translation elongation factor G2 [Tothia fuscella]
MLTWRLCHSTRLLLRQSVRAFASSTRTRAENDALLRTRNIGIIAHIDAGKTTTTERMLFYSGHTRRIGDVDDGSTVTDFLPAERARGITIQSAAISFNWPPSSANDELPKQKEGISSNVRRSSIQHNVNLIDTPGHADFTFEVLRSLRILDGAVCILDGVAGVEAQTEKVWTQANHYQIPRLIFVNKLDREGAAFHRTVKEIGSHLHAWPAVCQIPWFRAGDRRLCGVGDAVGLQGLLWEENSDGRAIQSLSMDELRKIEPTFAEELQKARIALVELLSEHDDQMVENFLEYEEDHLAIPAMDIWSSLRRFTLQYPQKLVPVFAGASFRNIGVQPLLDAVVDLLPSPEERPDPEVNIEGVLTTLSDLLNGTLALSPQDKKRKPGKGLANNRGKQSTILQNLQGCALAFKVVNDPKRGVLVYVRVYSGSIGRGLPLFNTNLSITERAPKLLKMYASDAVDIASITTGQIGVIVGLKYTRTGDTLLSYNGMNPKTGPPSPLNTLQLRPITVPPPVFFTSVEPASLSEEKQIAETLQILLREDPSLNVSTDPESGQTHLAGMGELHLEIARDRLIQDFKANATIGDIEINYREAPTRASNTHTITIDRDIGGKKARASCKALIEPHTTTDGLETTETTHQIPLPENNHLTFSHPTIDFSGQPLTTEDTALPPSLPLPTIISSITNGITAALARGPTNNFPIHSTRIKLELDPASQIFPDTTPAAISIAAREAVKACFEDAAQKATFSLMEPLMAVRISVPESDLGSVIHDLSSARGGQILSLDGGVDDTSTTSSNNDEDTPRIDIKKIYAPPDPFSSGYVTEGSGVYGGRNRQVIAKVPLREMVGYLKSLRSLTGGRGTFVMGVDRFEKVGGQRLNGILRDIRGS